MEDGDDTREEPKGGIEPYKPTLLHVVSKSGVHYWLDNPEEPTEQFKSFVRGLVGDDPESTKNDQSPLEP